MRAVIVFNVKPEIALAAKAPELIILDVVFPDINIKAGCGAYLLDACRFVLCFFMIG